MKNSLIRFLFNPTDPQSIAFQHGYLLGLAMSAIIILLLVILYFLLRKRSASGIAMETPYGALFISSAAISDLVRAVERDFIGLQIRKSVLYRKEDFFALDLRVNFPPDTSKGAIPAITGAVQQRIAEDLKSTFGIESVKEINVEVHHSKA